MEPNDKQQVDKRTRFLSSYGPVVIAWAVAYAIVARPPFGPGVIGSFILFPLGLLRWAHLDKGNYTILLFIVWGIYGGLTLSVMQARRSRQMFVLYTILLLLVIFGAVGCRRVLADVPSQPYSI